MSSLRFKAVICGVHFDPKKRTVKIQLEATSYVSLDELITLGPQDESVLITLESEQTRIEELPRAAATEEPATQKAMSIDEEGAEWLKKASDKLRESPDSLGEVESIAKQLDSDDEDSEPGKTTDWDDRKEKEEEEE